MSWFTNSIKFCYCRDNSTIVLYEDRPWQFSNRQMSLLAQVWSEGTSLRKELRRRLMGTHLLASQRASLSRMLRRLVEQDILVVTKNTVTLTNTGLDLCDRMKESKHQDFIDVNRVRNSEALLTLTDESAGNVNRDEKDYALLTLTRRAG